MKIPPVSLTGAQNQKYAHKLVNNFSEFARGLDVAKSGKVSKEKMEVLATNAALTGNESFLEGLKAGLKKLLG